MSRTDNTDPHWVDAPFWEPWHRNCQFATFYRGEACDLPPDPVVSPKYGSIARGSRWGATRCFWKPGYDYRSPCYNRGAAADYIRLACTKPQRRRVRDQLRLARAQHRAAGEVDVIAETEQNRHRGISLWA